MTKTDLSIQTCQVCMSLGIEILNIHLRDNVKARRMLPDGSYKRVKPAENEELLNSQEWMIKNRGVWHHAE